LNAEIAEIAEKRIQEFSACSADSAFKTNDARPKSSRDGGSIAAMGPVRRLSSGDRPLNAKK
jgi:hypothetical protein